MDTLSQIATSNNATESVLIWVVIAIVIIFIAVPLVKAFSNREEVKRKQYNERELGERTMSLDREKALMEVIRDNTSSYTLLATVLQGMDKDCESCRSEQLVELEIIKKLENANASHLVEIKTVLNERLPQNRRTED